MAKTLYQILGVTSAATVDEVRAAYTKLVERVPPLDAVQRLAVKEAFGTLVNPQRRDAYDASLLGATVVLAEEPERSFNRPLWAGLAVLLVAGTWWALRHGKARPPAQATQVQWMAPTAAAPAEPVATAAAPGRSLSAEELFARTAPSVVRVNALGSSGESVAFGSGVVIDSGTVVTNCHVARRGASLRVKHLTEQFDATVAMSDEAHDLCRLSVPGLSAPAVTVGRVASLRVGQKVYAIGSPQGLDLSLSDGMVSSLREGPDGTFVQTTAPISPGSSGGGLFDETGTLVGIVTFQMRAGQNLNFAVPADWIANMSNSAPRAPEREAAVAPPPLQPPLDKDTALIVGRWTCFGPLTGRGLELIFDANGSVGGSGDGKPIRGRYALQNRQLNLDGDPFLIEQLDATRMVLTQGQGRRLVCNH
jgi:hypothetical protein